MLEMIAAKRSPVKKPPHPRARAGRRWRALAVALTIAAAVATTRPSWAMPRGPGVSGSTSAVPAGGASVVVDISAALPSWAGAVAALLPDHDEAIAAGTDRLTLSDEEHARLAASGIPYEVVGQAPAALQAWPGCYRTIDETYLWLHEYARRNAWLVQAQDVGDSYCRAVGGCRTRDFRLEGSDLVVLEVTNSLAQSPKTGRLLVDGGLHARELPGAEVAAAFVEHLVQGYGTDAQITYLLDHREAYVEPISNPDGRSLVELGARPPYDGAPFEWRKNARVDNTGQCPWPPTSSEHHGVDLNRNHSLFWSGQGGSVDPCGETYRGRSAASEPETRSHEALAGRLFDDWRGPAVDDVAALDASGVWINLHNATAPGTVLLPWGWTSRPAPNGPDLWAIAERYAGLSGGYRTGTALYPVSGNTRDWAYGELGIPAFVIELEGTEFFTPCGELPRLVRSQMPPLLEMLAISDRPYERIRGPVITELQASGPVPAGQPVGVHARADDPQGDGAVSAIEVTLAAPGGGSAGPWLPVPSAEEGGGVPLEAVDGAFGDAVERASGTVDTSLVPPGTYYAVVRARNSDGHWGAGRAVWLQVTAAAAATPTPEPSATSTSSPVPTAPEPSQTPTVTSSPTAADTPTLSASDTPTATAELDATPTTAPSVTRTATPTSSEPADGASATPTPRGNSARLWLPLSLRSSR